eukprot:TRINITY_DN21453_c0_g1_i2.p1 TRINITY_DN21453_c0_g1~~TRINITY_DN21453_c0_g1_i2.p1  ORF type:complete len:352 (+),score=77.55 TRINITY_DN21453_c0_g1_i2:142-1197(+)
MCIRDRKYNDSQKQDRMEAYAAGTVRRKGDAGGASSKGKRKPSVTRGLSSSGSVPGFSNFVKGLGGEDDRLQVSVNSQSAPNQNNTTPTGWRESSYSQGRSTSPMEAVPTLFPRAVLRQPNHHSPNHGGSTTPSPRASPVVKSTITAAANWSSAQAAQKSEALRLLGRVQVTFLIPRSLVLPTADMPRLETISRTLGSHRLSSQKHRYPITTDDEDQDEQSPIATLPLPPVEFLLAGICTTWAIDESKGCPTSSFTNFANNNNDVSSSSNTTTTMAASDSKASSAPESERLNSLLGLLFAMSSLCRDANLRHVPESITCLLYTSDAADEEDSVDLGGRRIIKKKTQRNNQI